MRTRILFIILTVCCNFLTTYAQTIIGEVIDENDMPIGYANVILLNAKDSSFVAGCITNADGQFKLENSDNKERMLCKYYGKGFSIETLSQYCFVTNEGVSMLGGGYWWWHLT